MSVIRVCLRYKLLQNKPRKTEVSLSHWDSRSPIICFEINEAEFLENAFNIRIEPNCNIAQLVYYCSILHNDVLKELKVQEMKGVSKLDIKLNQFCKCLIYLSDAIEQELQNDKRINEHRNREVSCSVLIELQHGAFYFHVPVNVSLMRLGYQSIVYHSSGARLRPHGNAQEKMSILFVCDGNLDSDYIRNIAGRVGLQNDRYEITSIERFAEVKQKRKNFPYVYFMTRHYSGHKNHSELAKILASIRPSLVLLGACETAVNKASDSGIISRIKKILGRLLRKEPTKNSGFTYRNPVLGLAHEVAYRGVPFCYGSVWTVFEDGISEVFIRALKRIMNDTTIPCALCKSCYEIINENRERILDNNVQDIGLATNVITAMAHICVSGGSYA